MLGRTTRDRHVDFGSWAQAFAQTSVHSRGRLDCEHSRNRPRTRKSLGLKLEASLSVSTDHTPQLSMTNELAKALHQFGTSLEAGALRRSTRAAPGG